jgi:penicillin-binding protein 2
VSFARSYGEGRLGAGGDPGLDRRLGLLAALLVLALGVFLVRLFQLQILEGADLRLRSERNSVRTVRLEAPRGDILDREGRVLATSRPAFGVQLIPSDLRSPEVTFRTLGMLLGEEPAALRARYGEPVGRARFQPVTLAGDVSRETMARVDTHRFALPGVMIDNQPRRYYVEHELAAHLLGSIGEIRPAQLKDRHFSDYRAGEVVGQRGLEARLERHLRGRAGGRNLVVDVAGREVEVIDEVEPAPGGRVLLTLDLDLQRAAEEAFRSPRPEPVTVTDPQTGAQRVLPAEPDRMGALVALDPRSGDVLALVSLPSYDPNDFAGGIDAETWNALTGDEWRPLQDRALAGQYPPGSTYKAIVAAAGLAEGVIEPGTTAFCPGYYRLGRRIYRCWKRGGHGDVALRDALRESCDVFFYQLGVELGVDTIARYARAFGLGSPTGIDLPGEKGGLIPTRDWKERARNEPWIKGETVSASIGQGFDLVTPLQLAVAYAAIANGGTVVQPRVVMRLERWTGELVEEEEPETAGRLPVAPEQLALIREALTEAVEAPHGTGARARVRGVQVAGKTGTSQVVRLEHLEGLEDDEVPIRYRDHAWFVGFAPAEAPEIVVAALVEHGGGGGSVAAPVAQRVLATYFRKQRERQEQRERAVAALDHATPEVEQGGARARD